MKIPIHREGWPFIGLFAGLTAVLFKVSRPAGVGGAILSSWCVWFFRDPERRAPISPGLVVSPADGKVLPFAMAAPPGELGMGGQPRLRISIFMNIFDVHVNRAPIDGVVVALAYRPGRFFNASLDKASEHNERMAARIRVDGPRRGDPASFPDTIEGQDLAVVQIAGLVARRIKCYLSVGQQVRCGERYGIIRFGSRLDIYLPPGAAPVVSPGQRVRAGETALARLNMIAPPEGIAHR